MRWFCLPLIAVVGCHAAEPASLLEVDAALRQASAATEAILTAPPLTWQARWMGSGAPAAPNQWTCYRTAVELAAKPTSALAQIAADSKYWLWINGRLVVREGGLKRGPTPTGSYADVVDLAPYVVAGRNEIALLHWFFGKEGFSHKSSGAPAVLVDADLGGVRLVSGPAWQVRIHPAFATAGGPPPNFRLPESNLRYDARLDPGEWTTAPATGPEWQPARELGAAGDKPWGELVRRPIPAWVATELQPMVGQETKAGVLSARLPYNQRFTPWIEVEAPAGAVIGFTTDANEVLGKDGALRAEYVAKAGRQTFESPAWLTGHVLRITAPPEVRILDVRYRPHGYATAAHGAFSCDQPFYPVLWQKALRTLEINMIDSWSDCPDRERAQWWGDVVIDLEEAAYAFDRRADLLTRKGLRELAAWQRSDRILFAPIPAGNWSKELPVQILATVGRYGLWTYYRQSGDRATLEAVYPAVRSYLREVWKQDAQGLVIHRKGGWEWADWGKNIDAPLLDQAWFALALEGAAEVATLLGQEADAADFRQRRQVLMAGVESYWRGNEYRSPGYKGDTDDRGNALAVLAGLVPEARYPALRAVLVQHRNASPYMEKYVLEAQFVLGDAEGALTRMQQRYQGMVDHPSTTLWENFGNTGTFNHAWSGGPFTLLAQKVAGVANTGLGFATFSVLPQLGGLRQVSASVPTRSGLITVAHQREERAFTTTLRVPPGTQAIAGLPLDQGAWTTITLNGAPVATVAGAKLRGPESGFVRVELPPGNWVLAGRR